MAAAADLLSRPLIPVRDVARRVGYRHAPHFARAFRRHYGVSPSVFCGELRQGSRQEALPPPSYAGC